PVARASVFVARPEQDREHEEDDDGNDTPPFGGGEGNGSFRIAGGFFRNARRALCRHAIDGGLQVAPMKDVLRETERHADGRAAETEMPIDSLRDIARDDRTENR